MSDPTPIPNAVITALAQVEGVIIKDPKRRGVFADVGMWVAGALTAMTAGVGAATAAGWHAPNWVVPALAAGYAIYGAFATASHGIWKANIR